MSVTPLDYELVVIETGGRFRTVGAVRRVARVSAFGVAGTHLFDARVSVLAQSSSGEGWREYERQMSPDEAVAVASLLAGLELATRPARVEGIVDTSGGWRTLALNARIDEQSHTTTVHMHSSGFTGPDAAALRALLCRVFALAGYTPADQSIYRR